MEEGTINQGLKFGVELKGYLDTQKTKGGLKEGKQEHPLYC